MAGEKKYFPTETSMKVVIYKDCLMVKAYTSGNVESYIRELSFKDIGKVRGR
jgi:hypothetical protein